MIKPYFTLCKIQILFKNLYLDLKFSEVNFSPDEQLLIARIVVELVVEALVELHT